MDEGVRRYQRLLLVDDVCTEGSTLSACFNALRASNEDLDVVVATAGQMTVRPVVEREQDLLRA